LRELVAFDGVDMPILEQGLQSRRSLLADFRQSGRAVLVGSVSFWEGIDVQGEALSVVIIDKLPFAPPDDPVVAGRIRHLTENGGNAFRDYQLPQAITLLRQGAGRLIRGDTDQGVLMILDERVLSKSYGKTVLRSLPPFSQTRDETRACEFVRRTAPVSPEDLRGSAENCS
jgi:ATP-dependent DNA helicase DinG